MTNETNELEPLYGLRNKFIIIGLTGRLGSGCTSVADFLCKEFQECNFTKPITTNFSNNEERKYKIAYSYLEKNWKQFSLIRASDIIIALLVLNDFSAIKKYLKDNYSNCDITNSDGVIDNICHNISSDFDAVKQKVELCIKKEEAKGIIDFDLINDSAYKLFVIRTLEGVKDADCKMLFEFSNLLKTEFKKLKSKQKPSPFQLFGDNIRKTGNPINDDITNFQPSNSYLISKIINNIIKQYRGVSNNKEAWIVIDSIRNSMESRFFKERFSAFYMLAINTDDRFRYSRLSNTYTYGELVMLDKEYKNLKPQEKFYKQDIQTSIQLADIYLYNPNSPVELGDSFASIKQQLVTYLALILQPGIITPSPKERSMQIAYTAKYNSGCISRQVGAVVTDEYYSMKSIGWNNTAEGQTPCLLRSAEDLINNSDSQAFSEYEKNGEIKKLIEETFRLDDDKLRKIKGRNISFCFKEGQNCLEHHKNQVHTRSLHAEENAMLQIAKYGGEGLKNGFLFTTASPCELCSKKAYQLGIKKIFYIDPYPGIAKEQILKSGKHEYQPELELFVGAIGRAYHKLFEPFMAYKDELQLLLEYDYQKALNNLDKGKYKDELQKQISKMSSDLKKIDPVGHKDFFNKVIESTK